MVPSQKTNKNLLHWKKDFGLLYTDFQEFVLVLSSECLSAFDGFTLLDSYLNGLYIYLEKNEHYFRH